MSTAYVNHELLKLAEARLARIKESMDKSAIVPAGGPPQDPAAMAGGMPPAGGGMPPMPPMPGMGDPNAAGMGAPPAAVPPPPAPGAPAPMPGAPPAAPAAPGAPQAQGAGTKAKLDPAMLYAIMFKILKIQISIANQLGVSLPPDLILDQPPDPNAAAMGDQQMAFQASQAAQGAAGVVPPQDQAAGGAPEAPPASGPLGLPPLNTGMPPIEPMTAPDQTKQGEDFNVFPDFGAIAGKAHGLQILMQRARLQRQAS